jgi:hypothetical protein
VFVEDPANAVIVLVAIQTSGIQADGTLKRYLTLGALLGSTNLEATNTGYARKSLSNSVITDVTVDNTVSDLAKSAIPNQTWSAVQATGGAWSKLLVCFRPDSTSGTDASIVPLTAHDFIVTPDGNDIIASFNASTGFFSAA